VRSFLEKLILPPLLDSLSVIFFLLYDRVDLGLGKVYHPRFIFGCGRLGPVRCFHSFFPSAHGLGCDCLLEIIFFSRLIVGILGPRGRD